MLVSVLRRIPEEDADGASEIPRRDANSYLRAALAQGLEEAV